MGGRLLDWLGAGGTADRPAAVDMPARIVSGSTAIYFDTDLKVFSIFDESVPDWLDIDAASVAALSFATLPDVDFSTPPTDGQVFIWDTAISKLIPGDFPAGYGDADTDARIATTSIDALDDVDISTTPPVNGDRLVWDTDHFEPQAAPNSVLRYAIANRSGSTSFTVPSTGGAFTLIKPADTLIADHGGFWDVGNPGVWTIPAGVTAIKASFFGRVDPADAFANHQFAFFKNGVGCVGNWSQQNGGFTNPGINVISGIIAVTAGDIIDLRAATSATGGLTVAGLQLQIEAIA